MDFGALPPEVNSGRMYGGAGPGTLLTASAAWDSLAADLSATAEGYESVISTLTNEWQGPTAMSMAAAVAPYVLWMRATAQQCEQSAIQATGAAAAYEAAYAMTVPPPLIAANRSQLMALIATNLLGQNTPAIMATEAAYSEMWAQDAAAMYTYAASSASASTFSAFTPPPPTTNPAGLTGQAGSTAQSTSGQAMSSVSQALQSLSTPGPSSGTGISQAAVGTSASLGSSSASAPISALSSLSSTGKGATKGASTGVGAAAQSLTSALGGATGGEGAMDALGVGSDFIGLGADGAGVGADGGGIGMDLYGLSIDFEGAGSILGAEGATGIPGAAGLGDLGALGSVGPVGGLGAGASAGIGQAASIGTLAVPPSWADTVSSVTPLPAFDGNAAPGGWAGAPSTATGAGVSKLPLGGMVGRESGGAVHRIGYRPSLIPRSPVAG